MVKDFRVCFGVWRGGGGVVKGGVVDCWRELVVVVPRGGRADVCWWLELLALVGG